MQTRLVYDISLTCQSSPGPRLLPGLYPSPPQSVYELWTKRQTLYVHYFLICKTVMTLVCASLRRLTDFGVHQKQWGLVETDYGPHPVASDAVGLGSCLRIHISTRAPSHTGAAGYRPDSEPRPQGRGGEDTVSTHKLNV